MNTLPEFPIRPPFMSQQPVKVVPLSCHCKLKSLVPLLHELLAAPQPAALKGLPSASPPPAVLSLGFTYP